MSAAASCVRSRRRCVSSREADRFVEAHLVSEQQVAEFMGHREPLHRQSELGGHDDSALLRR